MRLERVQRTEAGLFIDTPDRPVGSYWVKLKATGEEVVASYDQYDATEEVDMDALEVGMSVSIEDPVCGYGWCLDQDPENEWRLVPESEFEWIGCKIPSQDRMALTLGFFSACAKFFDKKIGWRELLVEWSKL